MKMKKEKVYLPNPMRVENLIEILTKAKEEYGNIPIVLCTQRDEYDWERYELDDTEVQDEEFFFSDVERIPNYTTEKSVILFGSVV